MASNRGNIGVVVLYSAEEHVAIISYAGAPGDRGWLRIIEPGEPTEFEPIVAEDILKHSSYLGVVKVDVVKTKTGITYDLEKAEEESAALLADRDQERFMNWVQSCADDYMKHNKPVPPPDPAMMRIMERRHYDPKQFGIIPMGWEDPTRKLDETLKAHEVEKTAMQKQIDGLQAQLDVLIKQGKAAAAK